jgi:hypothetical protein
MGTLLLRRKGVPRVLFRQIDFFLVEFNKFL